VPLDIELDEIDMIDAKRMERFAIQGTDFNVCAGKSTIVRIDDDRCISSFGAILKIFSQADLYDRLLIGKALMMQLHNCIQVIPSNIFA